MLIRQPTVVDLATRAPLTCSRCLRQPPVGCTRQADQVRMECTVDKRGDGGKLGMGLDDSACSDGLGRVRMAGLLVQGAWSLGIRCHDVIDGLFVVGRDLLGTRASCRVRHVKLDQRMEKRKGRQPTHTSYLGLLVIGHPLWSPAVPRCIAQCSAHEMRSMLHGSMAVRLSEGLGRNKQFGETCQTRNRVTCPGGHSSRESCAWRCSSAPSSPDPHIIMIRSRQPPIHHDTECTMNSKKSIDCMT